MHQLEEQRTRTSLWTALVALLPLVALACGDYGAPSTDATTASTTFGTGLPDGLSVAEQVTSFETTVYPVLRANCAGCHDAAGPGAPRIAHVDSSTAWSAVVDNQKVNFSDLAQSRLVRRLGSDLHFCWSDCATDANTMLTEIQNWQDAIEASGGSTASVDVANLTSNTRTSLDGFEEVGDERYETGVIARWDFKELTGTVAADTSGVAPPMDLTLEGDVEFMTSYGIDLTGGRAIADETSSRKFYDRVADVDTGSQQYTLEMWLAPANITQDGPARIFTYSRSTGQRNMMLGQVAYQYIARNRSFSTETNGNGSPELETYDVDQDAQATLQHVVLTYDQVAGRRIYVDGRWTDDIDETPSSRLWNWLTNQQVIIGNERSNDRPWIGKVRFAAVYDRVMPAAAVRQNYEAGIGKRITLAFDVSEWTGGNSTIEFSLTELDSYSYLFCSPTFVTDVGAPIRVQNMRISLNGVVPVSGQGFTTMDALVTSSRQLLSRQCSVVGGLVDPNTDTFQLSFEQLGIFQEPVVASTPPTPGAEDFGDPVPVLGVRSFARVNASMAAVSGVDPQTAAVDTTYDALVTQLPATNDLRSFVSANQVGIAKLGIEYCDTIVEDSGVGGMRETFFEGSAGFGWTSPPATAFADPADVDLITDPILDKIVGAGLRGMVGGNPARDEAEATLDLLVMDLLGSCGGAGPPVQPACDDEYTRSIVKGLCTAAISSGAVHIH
ncbi:MAG: LamG domain-containing protein [bacterium]|nr:LamG domain-containing protein [bacterium]